MPHTTHRCLLSDALASVLARRSSSSDLAMTGVHELGHAVVSHRHGIWVKEVLVGKEALGEEGAQGLLGVCRHDGFVEIDVDKSLETRELLPEETARICAAGAAAEALAFGSHPTRSWAQRDRAIRQRWLRSGRSNDHADSMRALDPETEGVLRWDCEAGDFSRVERAWEAHRAAGRASLAILSEPRSQEAILALLPMLLERGWLLGHEINEELGWHRLRGGNASGES